LSIAEVAARTKIPLRQVSALEAEDYDQIPGGIFVRGHIRAAAKAVGLDPSELTAHFEEEIAPPPPIVPSGGPAGEVEDHRPRLRMAAEPPESRPNGHLIAALLILISIVLAIAWFGRERDQPPSSRNGAPAGTAMAASIPGSNVSTHSGEPRAVGTIGTTSAARGHTGGVRLSFEAQRVCWLALTVDGQRVAYRMLEQGETVTAHMRQRAAVRTGDAGALLVSVGSQPGR
jgi:cytoskeleton protein RodZ